MATVYMIKIKNKKDTQFYKKGQEGWLGIGGFHPDEYKDTAFKCKTINQAKYNADQAKLWHKDEWDILGIIPVTM